MFFVYLSKKIAIPNQIRLKSVSWNGEQGWIACGGEHGLLKVLKLESAEAGSKAQPAATNLSMNQTLEGHARDVCVVNWNEQYRKLTTSDSQGLIIVWMLHKGCWFEEMINNRNKSIVRDMQWTADGQKICIIYEDGAVTVGSVDGNRLWGKELKNYDKSPMTLANVQWSPDGSQLLFVTGVGEIILFDHLGNELVKLPEFGPDPDEPEDQPNIVGIDWYDGMEGYSDVNSPTFLVGMEDGTVHLRKAVTGNDIEDCPQRIRTDMKMTQICWNVSGTVFAVAGTATSAVDAASREQSQVKFFDSYGKLMRTLRVTGPGVTSMSWEGSGLRIALAVDSFIYFANIRADYKWAFFGKTLVYSYLKPERGEHCVMFWDTDHEDSYCKYYRRVLAIKAAGEHCLLAVQEGGAEDGGGEKDANGPKLILCNSISSPVDEKVLDFTPEFFSMTEQHVIAASEDLVYVWHYRPSISSKLTSADEGASKAGGSAMVNLRKKQDKERVFHVDDPPHELPINYEHKASKDPITCITACESFLLIGRRSGEVLRVTLPHLSLEGRVTLRSEPRMLALNCKATKMSVIDSQNAMSFWDFEASSSGSSSGKSGGALAGEQSHPVNKDGKKYEIWDMLWSTDNPDLLSCMEKTRMLIFRGNKDHEEPVVSSGYLCQFSDLAVQCVQLDDIMRAPDNPEKDSLVMLETKTLSDTRSKLTNMSLQDAYEYIEAHSHPRLWRILAEAALKQLDLLIADKAFVWCADYQGIQFVKRLQQLDDVKKQHAEVCAYLREFDEAESLYTSIDRRDLAIDLRRRLGDWFKVVQLVSRDSVNDDAQLREAKNKIGDFWSERFKWSKAVTHYSAANNNEALIQCFYALERFGDLDKMIDNLPENSPAALLDIGDKFMSVGMCSQAVKAYLKASQVKKAIDCCVLLNQWKEAVSLAETYKFPQIEGLMTQYAGHLLEKGDKWQAIDLYRRAGKHTEAARHLYSIATDVAKTGQHPLRAKKLYVLAAMQMDALKRKADDAIMAGQGAATQVGNSSFQSTAATLDGFMEQDNALSSDRDLENAWRAAEAFHFLLLAQRQLYSGAAKARDAGANLGKPSQFFVPAAITSIRLMEYEGILDPAEVHSVMALCCYYAEMYKECSRAFIKLESMKDELGDKATSEYAALAMRIFSEHQPSAVSLIQGYGGELGSTDEASMKTCVASGAPIPENAGRPVWQCNNCKHYAFNEAMSEGFYSFCPLCHCRADQGVGV